MKRFAIACMAFLVICICIFPLRVEAAGKSPSRVINVVYDDSGSMYSNVDTWCQAKYSMEVFAAMLGELDKMNVYYMSDYENGIRAEPRIVLNGEDGADLNVSKIHNQKTVANNTPFNSVKKACSDLQNATADEKWLVILTDGEFEDGKMSKNDIDAFLANKSDETKVMFLGMGPEATGITDNPNNGVYCVEARTNNQILNRITEICTRIFNSNRLDINLSSKTFSFDVPMEELIVFAQGSNVTINGIKRSDGSVVQSSKTPVEVKYSECDATNYNNQPTTDLLGKIATFKDDFTAGDYTVDVSGAETVEIYYTPNIEVEAYLTDSEGNDVANLANLEAGEYTITFGFVKAGTKEKVNESRLLGDVKYEAVVTNDGETQGAPYSNGDKIELKKGSLSIDVTASYLDYNSVTTNLTYDVYKDKTITFSTVNDPTYTVTSEGIVEKDYITIAANIDGQELTEEQWTSMDTPTIQLADDARDFKINPPIIEKTDKIGTFRVYPSIPNGKPSTGTYDDCNFSLSYQQQLGNEEWQGNATGTLKLEDTRSWWERNWDLFIKLAILFAILFILVGYLPFIKHYLPKSLKKKPYIKCIPSELGSERKYRNGEMNKNFLSTIVPYIPQTGNIKYVPKGVTGCPAMDVCAIKGRRMTLTNVKVFAGKDYITFDGEAIKKNVKKFETGAGVSIRVKRGEWTYVCSPNQENK